MTVLVATERFSPNVAEQRNKEHLDIVPNDNLTKSKLPETNGRTAPDCLHKSIIPLMAQDKHAQRWRILLVGSVLVLLADFGFFLAIPPQTEVFDGIMPLNLYSHLERTAKSLQCRAS